MMGRAISRMYRDYAIKEVGKLEMPDLGNVRLELQYRTHQESGFKDLLSEHIPKRYQNVFEDTHRLRGKVNESLRRISGYRRAGEVVVGPSKDIIDRHRMGGSIIGIPRGERSQKNKGRLPIKRAPGNLYETLQTGAGENRQRKR